MERLFKEQVTGEMKQSWRTYLDSLENSIDRVDKEIKEASEMTHICTDEWCEATEHVIDLVANQLFSISEPRWIEGEDQDSKRLKALKKRVYDLYANYKDAYAKTKS